MLSPPVWRATTPLEPLTSQVGLGQNHCFMSFGGWERGWGGGGGWRRSSAEKQMLLHRREFGREQTNQSQPAAAPSILNQYAASL